MAKTQVVAAIVRRDEKSLPGKRSLAKKSAPGWWIPISGKVESGETQEVAIIRQCFEVGLIVLPSTKVAEFEIDNGSSQMHLWLVKIERGNEYLKNDEHSEIRWFSIAEMIATPQGFQEDIEVFARFMDAV